MFKKALATKLTGCEEKFGVIRDLCASRLCEVHKIGDDRRGMALKCWQIALDGFRSSTDLARKDAAEIAEIILKVIKSSSQCFSTSVYNVFTKSMKLQQN